MTEVKQTLRSATRSVVDSLVRARTPSPPRGFLVQRAAYRLVLKPLEGRLDDPWLALVEQLENFDQISALKPGEVL